MTNPTEIDLEGCHREAANATIGRPYAGDTYEEDCRDERLKTIMRYLRSLPGMDPYAMLEDDAPDREKHDRLLRAYSRSCFG